MQTQPAIKDRIQNKDTLRNCWIIEYRKVMEKVRKYTHKDNKIMYE